MFESHQLNMSHQHGPYRTLLSRGTHEPLLLSLSHVQLFATPWTVAHQAPLSMGLWDSPGKNTRRLPFPPPGDLSNPGIEPMSPTWFITAEPLEKLIWIKLAYC